VDARHKAGHDAVLVCWRVTVNKPPTDRDVYQFKTTPAFAQIAVTNR
jgi:hypothetical protein